MPTIPLPDDILARAREMVRNGICISDAAKALHISEYRLRCELVPGHRERHRAHSRTSTRRRRGLPIVGAGHVEDRVSEDDAAARLAEVPADTRNLTGFLMGDPLPGRRAIDLKARAAAGAPIPIVGDPLSADGKTGAGASQAFTPAPVAQSQLVEDGIHHLADRHPVQIALVIHGDRLTH